MVSSGSSPLAVVRDGLWGSLLFAGVAWLAISWSVLRLEPADIALVAGPMVLFGALTEVVRALAGTTTWWLNAGMAVLFAVTGVVLLADTGGSFATTAALVGWFLMVRGAADITMSMMTRESDRIWGLLLVVGAAEALLGFFAASPAARAANLVVLILGALGLLRGVADLVAALRLRGAPRMSVLELPAERAAGVAGYSAGLTDFDGAPASAGPRHRAAQRMSSTQAMEELATPGGGGQAGSGRRPGGARSADLGTGWNTGPPEPAAQPDRAGGATGQAGSAEQPGNIGQARHAGQPANAGQARHAGRPANAGQARHAGQPANAGQARHAGQPGSAGRPGSAAGSFHDEVLRTTADLDMMLALAGVSGAAVGAALTEPVDLPTVPDTPEGVHAKAGEDPVTARRGSAG